MLLLVFCTQFLGLRDRSRRPPGSGLLAAFQLGLFLADEPVALKRRRDGRAIRVAPDDRGLSLALVDLSSWPEETLGLGDRHTNLLVIRLGGERGATTANV